MYSKCQLKHKFKYLKHLRKFFKYLFIYLFTILQMLNILKTIIQINIIFHYYYFRDSLAGLGGLL